ncbi:hypothetical protein VNO80_02591 [Phaseolus coccineus]|uniref:Uncharacterized protein n=1 Tax=Phaseolus coccineus TaxID=3886 RepID=A0AAN9NQK1_PHACN
MSSATGLPARSNKRPLYTEDSMVDSNILLAKPEKHQKKIKENDRSDTQNMRGMVEGRVERPNCSKGNYVMNEPISKLLARKHGKAQEKDDKTDRTDAPLSKPLMLGNAASATAKPKGGRQLDMAWQWNSLRDINNKSVVTCDFWQTQRKCSSKSDATGDGEPSGLNTPHTIPTVIAPLEEEKEEKHHDNLVNQLTKPKVTKVYVRRKNMVKRLDDAADQV